MMEVVMPAITPTDPSVLPALEESHDEPRPIQSIVTSQETFEGGGFPVHRPFPQAGADLGATDPFLMLDEMGPIQYGPGEAKGARRTTRIAGSRPSPTSSTARWNTATRRAAAVCCAAGTPSG
jgi:hypothetical protein